MTLYLIANALIWTFTSPDTRLAEAADGTSWYRPALALLEHGGFVALDEPAQVETYRPPLYPLFAAAAMTMAGGPSPAAIAASQILLLLLIGLLFRNLVRDWMPGWENFAFALLLFNPNVLSSAQFVQSETLFLAFTTLAFWAAAKYLRYGGQSRYALLTGLAIALACLTRPTAQFLLLALPVLFPLLSVTSGGASWKKSTAQGACSLAIALVVVAPWVALVASQGHGLALSDSEGKYRYIWDQVVIIEAQSSGKSYHDAAARITAPGGAEHDFIASQGEAWKSLDRATRNRSLADEGMAVLLSYPVADFAKALYRSQAQFYLAGGAGNWHNLFDIGAESVSIAWFTNAQDELWPLLQRLFSDVPPVGLVFSALAIGFTVLARLIGLVGIFSLCRTNRWGLLLIIAGIVLYFALIHVFVGNSRYRVAIEPMLMFLTIGGLDQLGRLFGKR